jgi:hypothetical protein
LNSGSSATYLFGTKTIWRLTGRTFNASSASTTEVIKAHFTATTLTVSPNPVTPPGNVTLTATVVPNSGSTVPTGSVSFYYLTELLASVSLDKQGVASVSEPTSGLPAGSYAVHAKYSGDANDASSSSSTVNVVLK